MDKTQHGWNKVEVLFETLAQALPHNTEICIELCRPWWKEMEAPTLTQLLPQGAFILSKKQKVIKLYLLCAVFRWI